jgi:hypothetical protein
MGRRLQLVAGLAALFAQEAERGAVLERGERVGLRIGGGQARRLAEGRNRAEKHAAMSTYGGALGLESLFKLRQQVVFEFAAPTGDLVLDAQARRLPANTTLAKRKRLHLPAPGAPKPAQARVGSEPGPLRVHPKKNRPGA